MTWCFTTSLQLPKGHLSFVEKWPMINANELVFVLISYLLFVLKIGPYAMENRGPLQIKPLLIAYNVFKVVNSGILAYQLLFFVMDRGLFPKDCDYDQSAIYTVAMLYWKFMVTKILDLFDTVFFVLRKKQSQITFLHVYHHVFMVVMTWSTLKYDPSDHWAFMALVNCLIHTVMYTYYGLSAMGPSYSKYLWWKKYVTIMQLVQFVIVSTHLVVLTCTSECPMHASSYWVGLSNLCLFVILFADFYRKRYRARSGKETIGFACTSHGD